MNASEVNGLLKQHLGKVPGFDENAAKNLAEHVAGAMAAVPSPGGGSAACYKKCQDDRDAAMAACALKGWPLGAICIAQAVFAFNACRHECDKGS